MNILELIVHQNVSSSFLWLWFQSNNHKQSAPSSSSALSTVPARTPIVTHTFGSRPTSVRRKAPSHAPLSTMRPPSTIRPSLSEGSSRHVTWSLTWWLSRSYSRVNGSEGLWPQLVRCAPFPSTAPYFKGTEITYPEVRISDKWVRLFWMRPE
jgi:hypothetical protein